MLSILKMRARETLLKPGEDKWICLRILISIISSCWTIPYFPLKELPMGLIPISWFHTCSCGFREATFRGEWDLFNSGGMLSLPRLVVGCFPPTFKHILSHLKIFSFCQPSFTLHFIITAIYF